MSRQPRIHELLLAALVILAAAGIGNGAIGPVSPAWAGVGLSGPAHAGADPLPRGFPDHGPTRRLQTAGFPFGMPAPTPRIGGLASGDDTETSPTPVEEVAKDGAPGDEEGEWTEIFAGVRDGIRFDPTPSPLRAPHGVALDGRGNSLEQARLLAFRLTEAGEMVRFAQGRLDRDAAAQLLTQTLEPASRTLPAAGVPLSRPSEDEGLLRRLSDHYWLQIRRGDRWIDLDPSFEDSAPGAAVGELTQTLNRLPESSLPSLELRVAAYRGPGPSETVLRWEGGLDAVANAPVGLVVLARPGTASPAEPKSGGPLGFGGFSPVGGSKQEASKGQKMIYQLALTRNWETLAAGGFELAGGPEDPTGADAVERLVLVFEVHHPDGRTTSVSRPLFEASRDAPRPPPFQRHAILVTGNRIPGAYLEQALAVEVGGLDAAAVGEHLKGLRKRLAEGGDAEALYADAVALERRLGELSGHLINLVFAATSDALAEDLARRLSVYPHYEEPRILMTSFSGTGDRVELSLDLRLDRCAAIPLPGIPMQMREAFLYGRGVMESVLEAEVARLVTGKQPLSTAVLMRRAASQGVPIRLYSHRERGDLESLGMPAPALTRVSATLERGRLVALPARAIEFGDRTRWAWWEIDPVTRDTLGVLDTGLHQAFVSRTLIETKGVISKEMAWVIGALTGATDTHWTLAALILEHGDLGPAALREAKAYLSHIAKYLCPDTKVGKVWGEDLQLAEIKLEIEGCWKKSWSVGAKKVGAEVTVLADDWCKSFTHGFTCASMTILNAYMDEAR